VSTFGATVAEIARLRQMLVVAGVSVVLMEATGDYWKPFLYQLAEVLNVELVNAKQARQMPGRKTDVADAVWLADLAAHDLLRPSFVPAEEVRQLRDLTRTRANLVRERSREFSRMEKNLEDACIKLTTVTKITGVSALRIIRALTAGERDPQLLASLADRSLAKKHDALVEALNGRFTVHHEFIVRLHLERIDQINQMLERIDQRVDEVMEPFRTAREVLADLPGFSPTVAAAVIAEIGTDMSVFPTPGRLASWAGLCPGQNESAGRKKKATTRPGDRYLQAALGIAVLSISRSKKTYLAVKYRRLQRRIGKPKAIVALQHTLIVIIWDMLHNGVAYQELGTDYYTRQNPEKAKNRALRQLRALGYEVELTPAAA
jgi:transposase